MNENFLEPIDTKELPVEFLELGDGINRLIDRIKTFVKYQKELFIGAAHELKTPLAVMKTKNEVTLLKERPKERYIEALRVSNKAIDEMNNMISNILEIGRQEGAQFETPLEIDLIEFIKEKSENFKIIAIPENKEIKTDIDTKSFKITTQPTLLLHILQNFVQNAIKFTPEGGTITIKTINSSEEFRIEIIDEGDGIDESKDLFAPFKRYGNKSGAGLGLFLAKSAADALGFEIGIKNRSDAKGAIAFIIIDKNKAKISSN
jgi:two-component system OmpR family sensor kinase